MNQNDKDEKEYESYAQWSKSYFGHGMPPSQNYYESTMSAFLAGIQYERNRQSEVVKKSFEDHCKKAFIIEDEEDVREEIEANYVGFYELQDCWSNAYAQGMKDAKEGV